MNSTKELKSELSTVGTIESITSVYQGIASLRMNQIKDNVAKTKEFIDGVAVVYEHAKTAYISSVQRLLRESKNKKFEAGQAFIKRNGKTVNVFISANEHLYGTLIIDVWKSFLAEIVQNPTDVVVIGKFGASLFQNEKLASQAVYFDLADDKPKPEEVAKITDFVSEYERVIVHHGQMRTLLTQEPTRAEITGGVVLDKPVASDRKYLFEPSPEKIMEFFEDEIIRAVFNQKILEHQLARFASRMVAMDQATQNAGILQVKLKKDLIHTRRQLQNIRQLEVFSGMSLWGKEDQQ